jgi:hypothetical protein
MRAFGFYPDDVLARIEAHPAKPVRAPSLAASVFYGAVSLSVVSVVAFSPWAFRLIRGEAALYAVIAVIYLVLAGVTLSRLVVGPGATTRFAALFACGFIVYAAVWCAFWFGLDARHRTDWWGNIVGTLLLGILIARAFGASRIALPVLVLLALYLAGYYSGGWIYTLWKRPYGALGWGAAYGLGFGAGLGYLLHVAQAPVKNRLNRATSPTSTRLSATLPE